MNPEAHLVRLLLLVVDRIIQTQIRVQLLSIISGVSVDVCIYVCDMI